MCLANVISSITWYRMSKSINSEHCDDGEICALAGPGLSIASNFALFPALLLFLIAYSRRQHCPQAYQTVSLKHNNSIVATVKPDDSPDISKIIDL